ncbi:MULTISPECIES: 2-hydroxychromene-2-carboxylate isomerase [unclassified Ruegeria]|nr:MULTISPECIES: 2-hydroxychromene-2-carboxylate isomerase [unclassified Ruegeria]NOD75424.1 2-hydroxychromene-2-carboxylate isomerase [Ruegeria sp. HKCCD4332]NOD87385.1 2-hydroxychromene-2-carboxylate isomerase [Ruegeria sp. HKCCD4318]NOE12940.1 2-hydroxychromene-2-carboxylate isomerase [Ruegeria sp. HKCCD4318-2]NOG08893.1 2-hydroxychromene-2-carboxylate isomerase [Ruegeria sp. HKCCD4315]
MTQSIDFVYDFCSPNAFLAHKVLPDLAAQYDIEINYVPVLLPIVFKATHNQSPFQAFSENRQKTAYLTHDLHRFARRRGLSFHMSPHFPMNTKFAMRGAHFAKGKSWETKYINAIFDAIWVHGQKVDELAVLVDILHENELPVRKIREAMTGPDVKQDLKDQTKANVRRGVFGVPTVFVGTEMFFGKNSLPNVKVELERAQSD